MSETSSQHRAEHQETQSMQSVTLHGTGQTNTVQSQQQQQQRSSSQAERSDRSGRSGGRQRIQRSSSSTSSSDQSDPRDHRNGGSSAAVTSQGGQGFFQNNASGSQGSFVSGERRQGRFRRQVIRLPDQPQGQVRQVRQRLPTPEPDTIERVYIQRTAGEVVEEITEIPMTPPPRVQERTVVEPAGPPQVIKRTVRVPARGGYYQQQQQQQQGHSATNIQGSSVSVGTDNYGQTQAVSGLPNYQQQVQQQQQQQVFIPQGNTNVYQGQATSFPFPANNTGAAFPSQPVQPPVGCHPAFCFYV